VAALVYVPGGWVGESRVVHHAHLFLLPIDAQAGLEPLVAIFLNAAQHGEAFPGLGVQDVTAFDSG
jgi:hypothetical protein